MSTTLYEASVLFGGPIHADFDANEMIVLGFATDSREVCAGDIFVAIRGDRVDGHRFTAEAVERGAVACLVEEPVHQPHILVSSVVESIGLMGSKLRSKFVGPVVGITGSVGKTTAKELVSAALSSLGPILKTPGNRNSEITGPLAWFDLNSFTAAAVLEMAMRGEGQIRHLASVSLPTIGLITNVGYAHLEMLGSRERIAAAKGELLEMLPSNGTSVLWAEDEFFSALLKSAGNRSIITFGTSSDADVRLVAFEPTDNFGSRVSGTAFGVSWHARLSTPGKHIALMACAAVATATACNVEPTDAAKTLSDTQLPPLRMEVVKVADTVFLIDAYNASPPSVIAGLETLAELTPRNRRVAVLGEMLELGSAAREGHESVGRAVAQIGLFHLFVIGEGAKLIAEAAAAAGMSPKGMTCVSSVEEAAHLLEDLGTGYTVLVKGSRALRLEGLLEEFRNGAPA